MGVRQFSLLVSTRTLSLIIKIYQMKQSIIVGLVVLLSLPFVFTACFRNPYKATNKKHTHQIDSLTDIAELPKVRVAEAELDAFVLRDGWVDAIEKAKNHFEKIEDYEMCQTCVSLIEEIKK